LIFPSLVTFLDETREISSNYAREFHFEPPIPGVGNPPTDLSSTNSDELSTNGSRPAPEANVRRKRSLSPDSSGTQKARPPIKPSTEVALFSQLPEAPQSNQSLPAFDHPLTIKELIDQGALDQAHHSGSEALLTAQISGTLEPIYSRTAPVWPLTDVSEALLLRHFVQNLAIWVKPYHPPTKELKIF
jgi:hypothetical protein